MTPHRRVAVTSPQTRLAHSRRRHRSAWRPPTLDPGEARHALTVYRAQRLRAAVALAALFTLLFGLPLLLHTLPTLDTIRVAGIPVSWLALVAIPFPAMVALAHWHLHHAERLETTEPSRTPTHRPPASPHRRPHPAQPKLSTGEPRPLPRADLGR
ncbi:hypothetical protein [Actinokineospora iranica]|uniref:Uncharacterized protein n=1 Tax=Actinokineospora iranica TaxID=1271860 RepID=A0A1G6ZE06_9PSEU|nr:hypothetical protein [Actinokineospora iranica]SDE00800.1 hypothetical protein SAMN05216174_1294 [Actinokineospora iranica]